METPDRLTRTTVSPSRHADQQASLGMVVDAAVLRLFSDSLVNPPPSGDYDDLGKQMADRVLGHVYEHDAGMTGVVRAYLADHQGTTPV
jgi:hypothetical protein